MVKENVEKKFVDKYMFMTKLQHKCLKNVLEVIYVPCANSSDRFTLFVKMEHEMEPMKQNWQNEVLQEWQIATLLYDIVDLLVYLQSKEAMHNTLSDSFEVTSDWHVKFCTLFCNLIQ